VRTDGKGDVAKTHVAYQLRAGVGCVPTPVYFDGRLYLVSDAGIVSALEPATGRVIWSARLGSEFFGSPVVIDRHIYVASSKGEMFVLATGDTFEELARNPLGEATQSTACVDGGRLYLRTLTHLVCLGRK
jgi:outer membrane protein assembly factor BamB